MQKPTIKICPQCRLKNPSNLSRCANCDTDISRVVSKEDAIGVSMFGSTPIESDIVPLDNSFSDVTQASQYGSLQNAPSEEEGIPEVETTLPAPKKTNIKKPWD